MEGHGALPDLGDRIVHGDRPSARPIDVTFLGNCGFLVQAGGKKIMFDLEGPAESYSRLAANQPPFDDIDAILISHAHGDHINPAKMLEGLSRNRKLTVYVTIETRDEMKKTDPSLFARLENRVIAVDPFASGRIEKTIAGMNVEFLGFYHGSDSKLDHPPQVLGFVVEMNGTRIFHLSDVDFRDGKNVKALKDWASKNEKINLLFCHWGLLIENPYTSKEILDLVKTSIRPEWVVPMHVIPEVFTFDQVEAKTRENYPQLFVFRINLEKKEFSSL